MNVMEKMEQFGIVPVVVLDDAKDAVPLARAMQAGGLPCAEVTLRTAAGLGSIEQMSELGDILVGAGTVLTEKQVELTHAAGGKFIISPDTYDAVIKKTRELDMVSMPGSFSPSEAQAAHRYGADFIKLF